MAMWRVCLHLFCSLWLATGAYASLRTSEGLPNEGDVYQDVIKITSRMKIVLPPGEWGVNYVFTTQQPDNHQILVLINKNAGSPFKVLVARYERSARPWGLSGCEKKHPNSFGNSLHGAEPNQLKVNCSQMFALQDLRGNIQERWKEDAYWGKVFVKLSATEIAALPNNVLLLESMNSQYNGLRLFTNLFFEPGLFGVTAQRVKLDTQLSLQNQLSTSLLEWRDRYVDNLDKAFFKGSEPTMGALAFNMAGSGAPSALAALQNKITDQPKAAIEVDQNKIDREKRTAEVLRELAGDAERLKLPQQSALAFNMAGSGAPSALAALQNKRTEPPKAAIEVDQNKIERERRTAEILRELAGDTERLKLLQQSQASIAMEAQAKEQARLALLVQEQERASREAAVKRLAMETQAKEQARMALLAQEKERATREAAAKEQQHLAMEAQAKEQARLALLAQEQDRMARLQRQQESQDLAKLVAEMAQLRAQLQAAQNQAKPALALAEEATKKSAVQGPTRRALVIGNDTYQEVSKLQNARADAKAMGAALQKVGFTVTRKSDLTERGMKDVLRAFKNEIRGGDEVVIFFAGHGVQLGSANFLLPVDIRGQSEDQVKDEAMPLQRMLDDIQDSKAKFALAIIDACRDNPFKTAGRTIGGRGLAATSAASGQMIIFSAGAGQQALDRLNDNDKDPNGLFTRIFLKEMSKPGIAVDRILRNVRAEVVRLSKAVGHDQVPSLYDQAMGDFYFQE